jgi:alkylhydroperoxidase family enzyme
MDTNASGASKAGASHEKIMAVLRFRETDLFTPAEKVALEVAEAMTQTPQRVTDELFQRLAEHYSKAEIVEMAAVVALENFRSRFNRCCGVEAHGFYPRLAELLATAGLRVPEAVGQR